MKSRMLTSVAALALLGLGVLPAQAQLAPAIQYAWSQNLEAYNREDVEATMRTVDSRSPDYEATKQAIAGQFADLDVKAELVKFTLIGHDDEFAVARIKTKTTGKPESDFGDNITDAIVLFHQENGTWKLWSEEVIAVEILPVVALSCLAAPGQRAGIGRFGAIAWILILAALATVLWALWDRLLFAPVEGFAHHEPDARYEALFPYYVELCATSQFRSDELGSGGSPGHAVMYLKGACRDTDAPYPKLRRCVGYVTDPNDPEHGAGISVNRWFRNVNWVAFGGRGLFYDGQVGPGEVVTRARLEAVSRKAVAAGIYRGIELWPYPGAPAEPDMYDFVTRHSAATDFALRYGRSALCGRVPVEPEMLDEMIHFLNDLNREFFTGTADYRWNGYHDNCVHTLRNALAAASIGEPIPVWATKLRQLFHLAVPANEAIDLAAAATSGPIDSYLTIFGDVPMRDAMLEFGWLPTRHGGLLVSLRVHPDNELFDTQPRLLIFQGPITVRTTRRLLKMLDDPRFTELEPNLLHFRDVYHDILATGEEKDILASVRGDRYRRVRRRYFAVIESALDQVERMRAELAAPPARGS